MKTRIPSLTNARFLGRIAVLALAFGFLVAATRQSEAATVIGFTPGEVKTTVNFSGLATGASVSTLAWTGSTALVTGTAARQPGSAPSAQVIQVTGAIRAPIIGPAFTSPFAASDTAYFQSSINRTNSASSGARIAVRIGATNLVGFGITDSSDHYFTMLANGVWVNSTESALASSWYDLRLVIDINQDDITLSVGHLFVRDVTNGDTDYRLVDGLSNINLGFTSTKNLSYITNWRIENNRSDVQIGNLIGGIGSMVIPEPTAATMIGLAALLGLSSKVRRFFSRH